jgi:hypothetical protein
MIMAADAQAKGEGTETRRPPSGSRVSLALQLMAISMCVLFFQGCQQKSIRMTLGPVAPALRLEYKGDSPLESEITRVAPHWILLNIIVLGGVFYGAPLFWPRLERWFRSREFYVSLVAVAVFFNSILFWMDFWHQAVFSPISSICDVMDAWFSPESPAVQQFLVGLASRLYFAFCLFTSCTLLVILRIVFRRYVFPEPDRWWQFNLRSLVTLTFIVGTGLGLAMRWMGR